MPSARRFREHLRLGLFWVACVLLSLVVLRLFVADSGVNRYHKARLDGLITGEAHRPFVERVLVPRLAGLAGAILPAPLERALDEWARETPAVAGMLVDFRTGRDWLVESLAAIALMGLSLLLYAGGLRSLAGAVYRAPPWLDEVVALAGLAVLPAFFSQGYVYDFATLAFFAWALALLARERWNAYFVLYFLSCWNRETTVLLAGVFALAAFGRLPRRIWLAMLAGQIVVAGAIKLGLGWLFAGNPGGLAEWNDPARWTGFLPGSVAAWGLAVAAMALLARGWLLAPRFPRRAAVLLPPLAAAWLLAGRPGELRVFYEFLPVALLLAAAGLSPAGRLKTASSGEI